MATITAQAPDGNSLNVDIPPGTDPGMYDAIADDAVKHYSSTLQSPVESAARGALRNFPLAQQATAGLSELGNKAGLSTPTYSDELQHLTEAAETGKAQNPKSYLAGAAAGSLAPLAIPVIGEGLEAAPILGNAALGAGQSISDVNLTKPTGKDVANAAIGAGIGGAMGAIGKGLQAVAPSEGTLGASMTGTGLGFNSRGAQKLMGGANPEGDVAELGNWANSVMTDEGKTLADYVRPGDKLKALGEIHDSAGKSIGDILDKVGADASLPKASLTKDLYPLADELETLAPKEHADVMGVINKINKLSDSGRLDLPALNKIKSFVGEASADNPTMSRIYGHLSDSVNGAIDEYGRMIGDPADRAAFDAARIDYKNASRLLPILRKAEGREIAQGPLGNSGLLGMIGGAGALAAGHPVGAAATLAGSAVGRPLVNTVGRNAMLKAVPYAGKIAGAGRGLSKAAQLELTNALEDYFRKGNE